MSAYKKAHPGKPGCAACSALFLRDIVFLAVAESSAPDLRHPGDDHEAVRIDGSCHLLDLGHLMVGNHAEDNLRLLMQIAALAVEHGDTPVDPGQDRIPDLRRALADDLHLGSAGTQQQHLIQRKADGHQQQNAVQQIFQRMEGHLTQHDKEIKHPKAHGNRNMEQFLQNQRRNVHTACGSAGPDHDTQ